MHRARSLLIWFALLFGFWELLSGTFQLSELVAGLLAAAVASLFAELVRSLGLLRFRLHAADAVKVLKLAWSLPVETCVLFWTLLRHGRPHGQWVTIPFEGDAGARAVATIVGTATPNAIVVDIRDGEALLHSLEPGLPGGREAG